MRFGMAAAVRHQPARFLVVENAARESDGLPAGHTASQQGVDVVQPLGAERVIVDGPAVDQCRNGDGAEVFVTVLGDGRGVGALACRAGFRELYLS